jgi:hypothetical protein
MMAFDSGQIVKFEPSRKVKSPQRHGKKAFIDHIFDFGLGKLERNLL